ncbi:sunset domain-containing protein [Microbacterium sp. GXF0217]
MSSAVLIASMVALSPTPASASTAGGVPQAGIVSAASSLTIGTPKVTGTATIGQTLKASPGTWTAGTAFAYQWLANGARIAKATGSTLALTASLVGKKISVQVTGSQPGYTTASKTSAATAAVLRALTTATPTITGTVQVGQKLTAKPGTWTSGTAFTYQWYIAGVAASKATASTFTIPASAAGKTVTVAVTGSKSGYANASRTSKATVSVRGILTAPTPRISGTPAVGTNLTAVAGTWTAGTVLTYQWYANGAAISKATGSTLALSAALVGKTITVKVTGSKPGYATATKASSATGKVYYPNRTTPASEWNCPSWAPIKGNANSGIYHVPGGRYYEKTKPEECFRTEAAAVAAGYRKSKL